VFSCTFLVAVAPAPSLVIAQEGDDLHPVAVAARLAGMLPNGRLEVLPPGGMRVVAEGDHAFRIEAAGPREKRRVDLSTAISAGLPDRPAAELRARSALPGTSAVEADQMAAWPTSRAQLVSDLGALPLVVLGVTEQPRGAETLTALQIELTGLSTRSVRRVVQGATHESLVARREHALAVVAAIRAVVADDLESLPDPILPVGTPRPGGRAAAG